MSEDNGEKILLYILVGFGLAALAYLFVKDQFKTQNVQQNATYQPMYSPYPIYPMYQQQPKSIDDIEKQLEERVNYLDEQTNIIKEQINKLGVQQKPESAHYQLKSVQQSRAGSPPTVKTPLEDKFRQKLYGML